MREAQLLIEKLASSIAERLIGVMQATADEGLAQWKCLHGWGGAVDRQVVARQAALNLVLRALICHCLDGKGLPSTISASFIIDHSNDLLRGLGVVLPPSSYLDHLAVRGGVVLQRSEIAVLADVLRHERRDIIGEVYAVWVPQEARRPLGQFWTPSPIARLMTWWAIQSPADRVLDPAFGSGIFLLTAIARLAYLGAPAGAISRQVAGIELSPLVFLMGLTNVLLRHAPYVPRLQWGDFLMPDRDPNAILREPSAVYVVGGRQMILPGMEVVVPTAFSGRFDAIVCNPPYTRHHHLPEAYKSSWARVMEQEYGIRLSRFSSLFAYFFVQASRMLSPTGRMAFITPATVFEASYSEQVKAFIRQQLRLYAIIDFDETVSVFDGVDTAACITLVGGPQTPVGDRVVHIRIHRWPGVEPVLEAIERGKSMTADWGSSRELDISMLEPGRKWTVISRVSGDLECEYFVPLSTLARVMRGIATGANNFFVLSDEEVGRWDLGRANLRPVLTKTREVPGYVFSQADFDRLGREGKRRWLLYLTEPVMPGTAEARYIRHGEVRGLHKRSLVKTRSLWYLMEQRDPAPIYFTYLSRKRPRFIYNRTDALALNVFLCIYPIPAISGDVMMLKALLAILNSLVVKDSLRYIGRSYGGDTIKIEPREMDRLLVLNPMRLTIKERETLAGLFDQLCRAVSEDMEEEVRQAIDKVVVDIIKSKEFQATKGGFPNC